MSKLGNRIAFRLPDRPKPLCEVVERVHLIPRVRAMTSPHEAFVLALAGESVRLIYVFVTVPPIRVPSRACRYEL
jgi:hypothetical protein